LLWRGQPPALSRYPLFYCCRHASARERYSLRMTSKEPRRPAGWYDNGHGGIQWWTGKRWKDRFAVPAYMPSPLKLPVQPAPVAQSKAILTPTNVLSAPENATYPQLAIARAPGNTRRPIVWVVVIVLVLVGIASCGTNGWRMGVSGNGYQVTCEDGTVSQSGGIQGACSHHGGER
jgi:hypothetical protein